MENFNYSRGRSNLRNDMKQITNVKSLGLTRERIVNADIMNSDIMWTLIMKLPHTEVKFYPEVKSQTGLSSLWVSCKRALIGSFSWGCFMQHRLQWFLWCCFWSPYFFNRSFYGRPCCETSIICISCWSRWFTSTNLKKFTAFISPLSTSYTGEQSS